jgi:hypothetical protein
MMSEENIDMKEYVEDKIIKYLFKAKNFSKEEMDFVDEYCKERYDNNRKLMLLDLIRYKEENLAFALLYERILQLEELILENKKAKEEPEKKKKVSWKGLSE